MKLLLKIKNGTPPMRKVCLLLILKKKNLIYAHFSEKQIKQNYYTNFPLVQYINKLS